MESKSWYASRTIWVNLISLIAAGGTAYGLDITAEQQAQIVTGLLAVVNVINLMLRAVTKAPIQ